MGFGGAWFGLETRPVRKQVPTIKQLWVGNQHGRPHETDI